MIKQYNLIRFKKLSNSSFFNEICLMAVWHLFIYVITFSELSLFSLISLSNAAFSL